MNLSENRPSAGITVVSQQEAGVRVVSRIRYRIDQFVLDLEGGGFVLPESGVQIFKFY